MSKKLDLNILVGEKKEIILGEKTYKIGDVPMSVVLFAESVGDNPSNIIDLVFKILSADNSIEKKEIEKLSIKQLKAVIEFAFSDLQDESVKKKLDE